MYIFCIFYCPCIRFCTSIVAQDEKGQIWHARNLDYKFADILRNITIQVHFQRQGKVSEIFLFAVQDLKSFELK